ncbi:uncharacterized protein LOC129907836 [Episyrphus balteatus]|uniref:uncharacterized protein LOC129907836 n=1 Tax=Episyrphus balteatus TaxID=286459 RepID=UPI0024852DB2|nr:uncharacterized protein LOC129907836 [Episyrphus balteatus]
MYLVMQNPLLHNLDKNPMKINFVGLATWNKHPAKWFYNCQFDENSKMEGQKNNEEQLVFSKLLPTDSNMKQVMEYFWSGFLNRHKSFFQGIVPTLDKFDDNQVVEFQQGVIELMKKVKKTSTRQQPIPQIDQRFGS